MVWRLCVSAPHVVVRRLSEVAGRGHPDDTKSRSASDSVATCSDEAHFQQRCLRRRDLCAPAWLSGCRGARLLCCSLHTY